MPKLTQKLLVLTAILAWMVLSVPATSHATPRLSLEQRDGYRVWLHSLETTARTRADRSTDERRSLFPFGALAFGSLADSTSLVAVARELDNLESRPRLLQEPSSKTPLFAITRARNHRHVAEFDTALAWYDEAARRDSTGAFARELGPETILVAAAAGDSSRVANGLARVLSSRNLANHRLELSVAHRFFIARHDTASADRLVQALAPHGDVLTGQLGFWHALTLSWRGQWDRSLDLLLDLTGTDGLSLGLSEQQRAWVLVAIPDLLVVTGHRAEAGPLYRALGASNLSGAAEWASCQAAVLDFLDGRFLDAGTAFEELCGQKDSFPWRAYACQMSELSDQMERLRKEGHENGAASHYQR